MIYTIALIIASLIPPFALLWYFERQDRGHKEPRKLKLNIFLWGVLAALMASFIENGVEAFYPSIGISMQNNFWIYIFFTSFLTAALVEESMKLWVVKTHAYNRPPFNEVMDGITYTIIASLGFASIENIFYVLEGGVSVAIIRALLAVPAHAFFSGVMGYFIGVAKVAKTEKLANRLLYRGLVIAIIYHGLYNFILFSESWLLVFIIPLMVIMGMHLRSKIKQAYFDDKITKKIVPKFTSKVVLKLLFGTLFIFLSVSTIILAIYAPFEKQLGLSVSAVFAPTSLACFALGYIILRKRKKPKLPPQSSAQKTT